MEEHNFCNGSSHYYSNIFSEQLHKNDVGLYPHIYDYGTHNYYA